jgi:hypothetical protein
VSRSSTLSTPTKSKSPFNGNNTTNNHVPIKVDVFITYWILNQKTLMVTASGFLFDGTKDDPTFSSSDIIESFVDKYESIHKLNLPMPNHSGTDYRRIFLKNTVTLFISKLENPTPVVNSFRFIFFSVL